VTFRPFINDAVALTEVSKFHITGLQAQYIGFTGMISLDPADEVDMRVLIDAGTADLSFLGAALTMHRVG
jgi:hypothetical protein